MRPNPLETADLVAFTEEILNEKLHFFVQCNHKTKDLKNVSCYKKVKVSCGAVGSVKYNCSNNLICRKIRYR